MSRGFGRCVATALGALGLAFAKPAWAGDAPLAAGGNADPADSAALAPDLAHAITFEGLPSCVQESALEARVQGMVRAERLNAARRVHGLVTVEDPDLVVQFQVFEGDELIGRRRLEFDSLECAPFQEAVELVLAMLLEGHGFEPPERSAPPPAAEAPPPEKPVPPKPAPEPEPSHSSPRLVGRFRLGGELGLGVLPAPAAGIRLEGGVDFAIPLALVARATWHFEDAIPIEGGGRLEFGGYRLAAMACYLHRFGWTVAGCAGIGFVSLHATGLDVPSGRAVAFEQGAAAFGVRALVPLARSWSLDFGVDVETWFSRPEYVLLGDAEPQVIATSSGIPVAMWVALGYSF